MGSAVHSEPAVYGDYCGKKTGKRTIAQNSAFVYFHKISGELKTQTCVLDLGGAPVLCWEERTRP